MYKFGKKSSERLDTCHPDLQEVLKVAIKLTTVDFGIAEGHRSLDRQKKLFDEGKSKIDGISRIGKHNYTPSMAVDIFAYVNGKASYNQTHLSCIAGCILTAAEIAFKTGLIDHRVRWGGNWDMDGEIISDQNFIDLPHFELK